MEQAGGVVVDGVSRGAGSRHRDLTTGATIHAGHIVIATGGYARTDGLCPRARYAGDGAHGSFVEIALMMSGGCRICLTLISMCPKMGA